MQISVNDSVDASLGMHMKPFKDKHDTWKHACSLKHNDMQCSKAIEQAMSGIALRFGSARAD